MTGNERRGQGLGPVGDGQGAPQGPPWSFDDLADLHAGLLTADAAADLERRISTDAEAQLMLAALDATQADLRNLPPITMPDDVAARLDAALAEESRTRASQLTGPAPAATSAPTPVPPPAPAAPPSIGGAQVVSLDRARRRRQQRLGWGAGILAAAAAAVAVVVAVPLQHTESGTPQAIPTDTGTHSTPSGGLSPLSITPGTIGSAFAQATNVTDYGPLENPDRMFACLSAVGIPNPGKPLGVRQVTLRETATDPGKAGVLVVLPGGKVGTFRLVVVGANCTASTPEKLADTRIPNG